MKTILACLALLFGVTMAEAKPLHGVSALAGQPAVIEGQLQATPQKNGLGLDIVLNRIDSAAPLKNFDVELTKQMHLIAVSSDFRIFLHEHVRKVSRGGHFRAVMNFPKPGLYHLYADSAPAGLGQQVVRFDLLVGCSEPQGIADLAPTPLTAGNGAYSIHIDPAGLTAGRETMLMLHINNQSGDPARDVSPYLGVPAHAVFIAADDLSYLHVHPMPVPTNVSVSMPLGQGMVFPQLMLHFTPPKPGLYKLWVQFMGGGQVQTVPFVLAVR